MRRITAVLLLCLAAPCVARAQDDWEVKRSPFDPRLVARYQNALERDPDDALALRKLVELYRKYRSVEDLLSTYKGKKSWQGRAIYADLLAQLGKTREAIAVLEAAPSGQPAIDTRLGALHRKLGQDPEARAAYERALQGARGATAKKPLL